MSKPEPPKQKPESKPQEKEPEVEKKTSANTVIETESATATNLAANTERSAESNQQALFDASLDAKTETKTVSATAAEKNAAHIRECSSLISKALASFEKLSLGTRIQDAIASAKNVVLVTLPELWKKFKDLSTLEKAFLVLGVVALVGVTVASWKMVRYCWPKFLEYMKSEQGVKTMANCALALKHINDSGVVGIFADKLEAAQGLKLMEQAKEKVNESMKEVSDGVKSVPTEHRSALIASMQAALGFVSEKVDGELGKGKEQGEPPKEKVDTK